MRKLLGTLMPVVVAAAVGCAQSTDVEKVPVGTEVQVTRQDGGVVQGRLAERDSQMVIVDQGSVKRTVSRQDIANVQALPAIARFREYTVPEDSDLTVRLNSGVASDTSRVEDPVVATLIEPVIVDQTEVIPAGSVVRGVVTAVQPSGRVKGQARLVLRFDRISVRSEQLPMIARLDHAAPASARSMAGEEVRWPRDTVLSLPVGLAIEVRVPILARGENK